MPAGGAPALRDGYLVKRGHVVRSWRRRFCSLGVTELRYFRSMGEAAPRGTVSLDGAKVDPEVPKAQAGRRGNVFAVIERSGKRFLFQCHDASERVVSGLPMCWRAGDAGERGAGVALVHGRKTFLAIALRCFLASAPC